MKSIIKVFFYFQCLSTIGVNANPLIGETVRPAEFYEFPFVVSLGFKPATDISDHFCTGILITKRHVLTASHCFSFSKIGLRRWFLKYIKVTIGSHWLTEGRKYGITSFTTYPEWAKKNGITYDKDLIHDVAVVTLNKEVKKIVPVTISEFTHEQIHDKDALTAAWGIGPEGKVLVGLRKAQLHVISESQSKANLDALRCSPSRTKNHLFTVTNFGREGDSGGPLLIHNEEGYELVGVNSKGYPSNKDISHPNAMNDHQSVHYYRDFIKSFIDNTSPPRDDEPSQTSSPSSSPRRDKSCLTPWRT